MAVWKARYFEGKEDTVPCRVEDIHANSAHEAEQKAADTMRDNEMRVDVEPA